MRCPICGGKEMLAMQMLYNSDQFAVVVFEMAIEEAANADAGVPRGVDTGTPAGAGPARDRGQACLSRGGYEIVDKLARKEIFIEGALAERFQRGVQALVEQGPTEEALDAFIADYADLAQQPLVLH